MKKRKNQRRLFSLLVILAGILFLDSCASRHLSLTDPVIKKTGYLKMQKNLKGYGMKLDDGKSGDRQHYQLLFSETNFEELSKDATQEKVANSSGINVYIAVVDYDAIVKTYGVTNIKGEIGCYVWSSKKQTWAPAKSVNQKNAVWRFMNVEEIQRPGTGTTSPGQTNTVPGVKPKSGSGFDRRPKN